MMRKCQNYSIRTKNYVVSLGTWDETSKHSATRHQLLYQLETRFQLTRTHRCCLQSIMVCSFRPCLVVILENQLVNQIGLTVTLSVVSQHSLDRRRLQDVFHFKSNGHKTLRYSRNFCVSVMILIFRARIDCTFVEYSRCKRKRHLLPVCSLSRH